MWKLLIFLRACCGRARHALDRAVKRWITAASSWRRCGRFQACADRAWRALKGREMLCCKSSCPRSLSTELERCATELAY